MSKGEIISHLGEGKYRIRQKLAVERIQQELTRLGERIAQLAIDLPTRQLELLQAESAVEAKAQEIDAAIPALQAGVAGARAQIAKLQADLVPLHSAVRQLQLKVATLTAEKLSVLKRQAQLEAVPEGREIDVWCADYSLELTGEVGLVDVNDEGGQGTVIQPGYEDDAVYSTFRDGALFPDLAQSGAQIFFNAAILPGVQKWSPRYRVGIISNLQGDTCTITLNSASSSAQGLDINKDKVLVDVPIKYMDCDGGVFEDGDEVVVRFTRHGPLVIGFYTNPKACAPGTFAFMPTQLYNGNLNVFGLPEIPGSLLGTRQGTNPVWLLQQDSAGWAVSKYKPMNYGTQDWQSNYGLVLTWRGAPGRCYRGWSLTLSVSDFFMRSTEVFCRGEIVADIASVIPSAVVYGAAVRYKTTLTVIARNNTQWAAIEYPWNDALNTVSGAGVIVHTWPVDLAYSVSSGFHFNRSGTEAVITLNDNQEKVATQTYIAGTGPQSINVIWERDYEAVATLTLTPQGAPGGLEQHYQVYQLTQRAHQIPIYVDYVGDTAVTLYVRHSEYTNTITLDEAAKEYQATAYQATLSFVLSTGEVLASIGPYKNTNFFLGNYDTGGSSSVDVMTRTDTEDSRTVTGENVFFDVRSKVVLFEVAETVYHSEHNGAPDVNGYVTGTISNATKVSYEMYVGGSQAIKKDLQVVSTSFSNTIQFQNPGNALGGITGEILGPVGPKLINTQELVNVGYYKSGAEEIATLFVHYHEFSSVTGVTETAFSNYISGYSSVELELFGGLENMTLYGLGRV